MILGIALAIAAISFHPKLNLVRRGFSVACTRSYVACRVCEVHAMEAATHACVQQTHIIASTQEWWLRSQCSAFMALDAGPRDPEFEPRG